MRTQRVPESSAIDLVGPYLAARATCPFCGLENTLLHTDGPASPVKTHEVCKHIRAYGHDDEGEGFLEFEADEKEQTSFEPIN